VWGGGGGWSITTAFRYQRVVSKRGAGRREVSREEIVTFKETTCEPGTSAMPSAHGKHSDSFTKGQRPAPVKRKRALIPKGQAEGFTPRLRVSRGSGPQGSRAGRSLRSGPRKKKGNGQGAWGKLGKQLRRRRSGGGTSWVRYQKRRFELSFCPSGRWQRGEGRTENFKKKKSSTTQTSLLPVAERRIGDSIPTPFSGEREREGRNRGHIERGKFYDSKKNHACGSESGGGGFGV